MEQFKVCNVCNANKLLSDFYYRKETGKYRDNCKKCKPLVSRKDIQEKANAIEKVCKHCGDNKPISEYNKSGKWAQPYCKPCDKIRKQKHEIENATKYKAQRSSYYTNTVKPREDAKRDKTPKSYKKDDIEYIKRRNKEYRNRPDVRAKKSQQDKQYKARNYDKVIKMKKDYYYNKGGLQRAKDWQASRKNDFEFVTKKRLRGRIYMALKRGIKSQSTMELLGCTIDQFKEHFQSLFTKEMNWDKYMAGEIVIDHILPCKIFDLTVPEQQKKCFHYTNLQPLFEIDNLRKGASVTYKKIA